MVHRFLFVHSGGRRGTGLCVHDAIVAAIGAGAAFAANYQPLRWSDNPEFVLRWSTDPTMEFKDYSRHAHVYTGDGLLLGRCFERCEVPAQLPMAAAEAAVTAVETTKAASPPDCGEFSRWYNDYYARVAPLVAQANAAKAAGDDQKSDDLWDDYQREAEDCLQEILDIVGRRKRQLDSLDCMMQACRRAGELCNERLGNLIPIIKDCQDVMRYADAPIEVELTQAQRSVLTLLQQEATLAGVRSPTLLEAYVRMRKLPYEQVRLWCQDPEIRDDAGVDDFLNELNELVHAEGAETPLSMLLPPAPVKEP